MPQLDGPEQSELVSLLVAHIKSITSLDQAMFHSGLGHVSDHSGNGTLPAVTSDLVQAFCSQFRIVEFVECILSHQFGLNGSCPPIEQWLARMKPRCKADHQQPATNRPSSALNDIPHPQSLPQRPPLCKRLYYPGLQVDVESRCLRFDDMQRVASDFRLSPTAQDPPVVIWHPQIRGALQEIEKMHLDVDRRIRKHAFMRSGKAVDPSQHDTLRISFLDRRQELQSRMQVLDRSYEKLWDALRTTETDVREEATRTFAAMASLYMICWLYRFRGILIDHDGCLVLRTFAHVAARDNPIYTFPSSDAYAMAAFPQFRGAFPEFISCVIVNHADRECNNITLPKLLAYAYVGKQINDERLIRSWILPQWVLCSQGDLPVGSRISIERIKATQGREWFSEHERCPWEGEQWSAPKGDGLVLGADLNASPAYAVEEHTSSVAPFGNDDGGLWYYWCGVWS